MVRPTVLLAQTIIVAALLLGGCAGTGGSAPGVIAKIEDDRCYPVPPLQTKVTIDAQGPSLDRSQSYRELSRLDTDAKGRQIDVAPRPLA